MFICIGSAHCCNTTEHICIINKNFTCEQAYNLIRAVSFPYFGAHYNNLIIWKANKVSNLHIDTNIELGEIFYNENGTFLKFEINEK